MKKHVICVLVLVGCLFMVNPLSAQETIDISTGKWPPWAGKELKNKGFVLHVVKEVFNKAGYEVNFKFSPWKRTYVLVKSGEVPASAYWYESEERKKHTYYSDPVTKEDIVFFHKKDNPIEWENLRDLKEYKIGASKGNTYTDRFWDLAEQGVLNLDEANNDITNFKKLIRGRIDIFPCSEIMGYKILRNNFSDEVVDSITHHEKPLTETTGHIIFSKAREDGKKLLRIFNKNLKELKSEGTYSDYMEDLKKGAYSQ